MGVNHTKLNHKVRKVAPLESKDVYVSPDTTTSGTDGLNGTSSFGRMGHKAPTSECQLPPLRETLYGRGSVVPSPLSYDVPPDLGTTSSIIKQHPPRRLQKLEPAVLPSLLAAERMITKQEATAAKKEEELGIKVVTVKNSSTRQHLQNMQMQEKTRKREQINNLQSQGELKRNIHREAKINKHKMKEIKAKKVRENVMKRHEDEGFVPVEHEETFNVDHAGNPWPWNIQEPSPSLECHRGKGKLQMWFQPHCDESNYDSSSTDSLDSWIREDAKSRRRPAALFRTRTEKIPTLDEFFDREF